MKLMMVNLLIRKKQRSSNKLQLPNILKILKHLMRLPRYLPKLSLHLVVMTKKLKPKRLRHLKSKSLLSKRNKR